MDWLPPEIPEWAVLVAIGIVGLIIGLIIGRMSGSRAAGGSKQLKELKQEHQNYQQDVTLHFEQTGQLLRTMTEQYKALHDHLASGSADFSGSESGLFPTLGHEGSSAPATRKEPTLTQDSDKPEPKQESQQPEAEGAEPTTPKLPPDVPASQEDAESHAALSMTEKPKA